jgi:hypothetical protein
MHFTGCISISPLDKYRAPYSTILCETGSHTDLSFCTVTTHHQPHRSCYPLLAFVSSTAPIPSSPFHSPFGYSDASRFVDCTTLHRSPNGIRVPWASHHDR